jgi:hypothetical protein
MSIPEYFAEALETRFGGRFRIRWSDVEHVFMLEQKVRRALAEGFAPIVIKSERHRKLTFENQVRARDGYVLSMKITPGTHTYCAKCDAKMDVPAFKSAQIPCPVCAQSGHRTVFAGGYWPLSDALLHELDRTDPDRGGSERVYKAQQAAQMFAEKQQEWEITNPAEAAFKERFNRLVGIPQTGYTGKVKAGSLGAGTQAGKITLTDSSQ